MKNKVYLTAAIPYVNASPHLGHALEFVQVDTLARFYRLQGKKVLLLTGADENSLKNVQMAKKKGISPQKLCDQNSRKFQNLISALNTTFNVFQRSSSEKHFLGTQKLWQLCQKKGDIYKKKYEGLYCVGCEAFYTKEELTSEGLCPEHLSPPQKITEENYFFRLSFYQKKLEEIIEKGKIKIIPQTRKNEILSFIKKGLNDFSISRSRKRARNWGIPVPGDKEQIIYVWFDALNVYQTGVGFGWDNHLYQKWWPADIHLIGKGITRFHAVFWPAILLSAGLPLPRAIFVHGYLTVEGQKMSKTLGNIIDPFVLLKKYGVEPLRYYLLREIPSLSDGDFSEKRFREIYNADLANNLGNLISRLTKLLPPEKKFPKPKNFPFDQKNNLPYQKAFEEFRLNEALQFLWQRITALNKKIDEKKPWTLKGKELEIFLAEMSQEILEIAFLLSPFLPQTAERIEKIFSQGKSFYPKPLFPRLN